MLRRFVTLQHMRIGARAFASKKLLDDDIIALYNRYNNKKNVQTLIANQNTLRKCIDDNAKTIAILQNDIKQIKTIINYISDRLHLDTFIDDKTS